MSLYAVTLTVSLLSSTHRKRIDRIDHEFRVEQYAPKVHPTVDVFLPTAGESLDLLANTYLYVAQLKWPAAVRVLVLDDGGRKEVRELADRYGFDYSARTNRGEMKKAGNLRHGLGMTHSEFILILDADFVPRADLLRELVPYTEDPQVAIVQSPQFFDTSRSMSWLQRCAGATQELFYRMIQPSRDAVGAAICVGTCAIYRRSALETAGGFAQIGHSEDVHTGVNLVKAGFHLRYVPIIVSRGICPDTALGFMNQQYRWCTGSMSLLRDPSFHAASHINFRQRLCFWAGFLYYISTALNAFVAAVPALVMLYLVPQWVHPMNSVWLLGALVLWFGVLPGVMRGRWRIDVLRVQTLYAFAHAIAILHICTGRTQAWVATGAVKTRTTPLAVTIGRTMKGYLFGTQVLLWYGLVRGTLRYGLHNYWAMVALGMISAFVHVPLLLLSTRAPGHTGTKRRLTLRRGAKREEVAPNHELSRRAAHTGLAQACAQVSGKLATAQRSSQQVDELPPRSAVHTGLAQASAGVSAVAAHPASPGSQRAAGQSPAADGPRRWRPDIQGLRAIAVTLVVLYHAQVPRLTGGYVGVDVFFVISGFLITGQLLREAADRGRVHLLKFYLGRVRRLLPAAALVTIVTVVAARQFMSIFQVQSIIKDAFATAYYGINYRLAAEGVNYQQATATPSPLQHFWSLAVEEQFYILWPVLIGACVLIGRRHHRRLVLITVLVVAAWSLWMSVSVTKSNPPLAYFAIHTRAWELAIGAIVALGVRGLGRVPRPVAALASWAGVGGIIYSAFHYNDSTPFPGTAALLPVLSTALVIAAGSRAAPARWGAERVLALRPMQQVGKLSYGWYLWHWPMLIIIPLVFGYDFTWQLNLEIAALSLWFALLTVHLLERPTQRGRLRMATWSLAGAAIAASVIAVAVLASASLPNLNVGGPAVAVGFADTHSLDTDLGVALGLKAMPAHMTPSLLGAPHDVPISDSDGCHADLLVVEQPACVFGDPAGTHTLVLTGDSHAQQWLPALDAEGKLLGWRVIAWTKAACSFANLAITNVSLHREFRECDEWRTMTVARIKALRPAVVVVGQSDNVEGTQFSNTTWADATATAMTDLATSGLKVIYILDTPVAKKSGPDCVAENITNVTRCIRDRNNDSIYVYPGRHEAVAAALARANIAAVDPTNWLCAPSKCPMIVHDILVYRDATHITATYSRFLAPMTRPMFVSGKPS
ncbi:MAG: acyltransferase family protein [Actinomycetota bacterium]|nr:acyltransferase family protein [Actinomycetota bacterium]